MPKFALAVLLMWAMHASAIPTLTSHYQLAQEIVALGGWTQEKVPFPTGSGRERYLALARGGWDCRLLGSWGVCRIFSSLILTPEEQSQILANAKEKATITVGVERKTPECTHDSPHYQEYQIFRDFEWGERRWSHFFLFDSVAIDKLNLPDEQGQIQEAFTLKSDGQLELMADWPRRLSEFVEQTVYYGLRWRPILEEGSL